MTLHKMAANFLSARPQVPAIDTFDVFMYNKQKKLLIIF
jgi:hypothetical protein